LERDHFRAIAMVTALARSVVTLIVVRLEYFVGLLGRQVALDPVSVQRPGQLELVLRTSPSGSRQQGPQRDIQSDGDLFESLPSRQCDAVMFKPRDLGLSNARADFFGKLFLGQPELGPSALDKFT
jgi:hypothetical protein